MWQVRDSALGLCRPDVVGRTEVRVIQQGPVAEVHFGVGYPGEPLGVFAARDIARGDFLGVITGELRVESDEVGDLGWGFSAMCGHNHARFMSLIWLA